MGTFFGSYIIGSLEAGVVATGIGGYWVQLVEGLVMAASVILNVIIGEDGISAAVPSRPQMERAVGSIGSRRTARPRGSMRESRAVGAQDLRSREERGCRAFRSST